MADGRDLDNYSAQTQAATTKYQSTGRTSTLSGSTIGSSVNGYSQSANLAKPCVFDFNLKTNVCPTCQGTGRVPKGERRSVEPRTDAVRVNSLLVRRPVGYPKQPQSAPELELQSGGH